MGPIKPIGHSDGPLQAHGPLDGSPEAHGLPDEPPKLHGPRGHCQPLPPLSDALVKPIMSCTGRLSDTKTIDLGWIPGQIKPKAIQIVKESFPA